MGIKFKAVDPFERICEQLRDGVKDGQVVIWSHADGKGGIAEDPVTLENVDEVLAKARAIFTTPPKIEW